MNSDKSTSNDTSKEVKDRNEILENNLCITDIILAKRSKLPLTDEQIKFWIKGVVKGTIPDYQTSALLMAITLKGMNDHETAVLTEAMRVSGTVLDLSDIPGKKVDKHSSGGVGDKVSLILCPLIASCGAKVAKATGRGLGHTGGTVDKMESIPGMKTTLPLEEFKKQVKEIGFAMIAMDENIDPADKKLYAIRDVTSTVDSKPLIASSIMSKKLACGSDCILLDVKYGAGAFMKTKEDAIDLAKAMVNIGKTMGKDVKAEITSMNQPLGKYIGNALEIKEVIQTLKGNGPEDLNEICLSSGAIMLVQGGIFNNKEDARKALEENLKNGKAFEKFKEFVKAQGGDVNYIDNPDLFPVAKTQTQITAKEEGYISNIDAFLIGLSSCKLGGGRESMEDKIDMSAGIVLNKKVGDHVNQGELLCTLHTNKEDISDIIELVENAYDFQEGPVEKKEELTVGLIE